VLFSVFFCYFSVFFSVDHPGKGSIVLFSVFFAFFDLFSVAPPPPLEIFLTTPLLELIHIIKLPVVKKTTK